MFYHLHPTSLKHSRTEKLNKNIVTLTHKILKIEIAFSILTGIDKLYRLNLGIVKLCIICRERPTLVAYHYLLVSLNGLKVIWIQFIISVLVNIGYDWAILVCHLISTFRGGIILYAKMSLNGRGRCSRCQQIL